MTATKVTSTPESSSRPRARWGTILALLLWSVPVTTGGHVALKQAVIVDTDMALDDARALILLAQVPSIEIAAVVTVDGSSSPRRGAENVLAIMSALGKTGVLVGAGAEQAAAPPPWRAMSELLGRTELPSPYRDSITAASDILKRVSSEHPEGLTYVCLGPLSNLAELIRFDPVLARGVIHRVYIQGDTGLPRWTSWNTKRDTLAARIVFSSGLPIYSCALPDSAYLRFSDSLLTEIEACATAASRLVARLHRDPGVRDLVHEGHFRCWDETVALIMTEESLAHFAPVDGLSQCYSLAGWDASGARRRYIGLLTERD